MYTDMSLNLLRLVVVSQIALNILDFYISRRVRVPFAELILCAGLFFVQYFFG